MPVIELMENKEMMMMMMITMKRLKCRTHGMQRESKEGESKSLVLPGTDEGEKER
jgi:hypothetical protein